MEDLPGPGIEDKAPALAGGFLSHDTTREAQDVTHFMSIIKIILFEYGRGKVEGRATSKY